MKEASEVETTLKGTGSEADMWLGLSFLSERATCIHSAIAEVAMRIFNVFRCCCLRGRNVFLTSSLYFLLFPRCALLGLLPRCELFT